MLRRHTLAGASGASTLAHVSVDAATLWKTLNLMVSRLKEAYRYWSSDPAYDPIRRGYLVVMTPALLIAAVWFAWAGGWGFAVACVGLGLSGAWRLVRLREPHA